MENTEAHETSATNGASATLTRSNPETLSDSEAISLAAMRLRQSGKKSLGNRVEAILKNINGNATAPAVVVAGDFRDTEALRKERDELKAALDKSQSASAPIAEINATQSAQVSAMSAEIQSLQNKLAKASKRNGATQASEAPTAPTASADASLVPQVETYVAQNGEQNKLEKCVAIGVNALLTGPTGCGKTNLAEFVAMSHNRELYTVQGGAGASYERIIATKDLNVESGASVTTLTHGILPTAMKRGAILYIDEPNGIPSEVLFYLFSAMDYRRTITLENGEVIKAAKGFVVIGAMNEGAGYSGTAMLNAAFRQRSAVIDMHYLPQAREAKLLIDRCGISREVANKLTKAAAAIRSAGAQVKTPIGTRALLHCASLIASGLDASEAIEIAIVNQVPSQLATERKSVQDTVAAFFGQEVQ